MRLKRMCSSQAALAAACRYWDRSLVSVHVYMLCRVFISPNPLEIPAQMDRLMHCRFLANRQARHPLGGRMHGHSAPVSSRLLQESI